jgi:TetR/AcrR family transcriptional regulator, transcriptional repressor for nem operon
MRGNEAELRRSAARFASIPAGDLAKLDKAVAAYLSPEHVGHPELGCALPSLAADVARSDSEARAAFEDGLLAVHAALKRHLQSDDAAWAMIAQSVGAVVLARAMQDANVQQKLLRSVKRSARALVGGIGSRD